MLSRDAILQRLAPPPRGKTVRVLLDTDTYNEIDDQFALAYLYLRRDRIALEAVTAAPFDNHRVESPAEGMAKSKDEIHRLLELLEDGGKTPVFAGSTRWLTSTDDRVESDAADEIVRRGMASPDDDPLYVVAIGAITNVASALNQEPKLTEKIVVCWLGSNSNLGASWGDGGENAKPIMAKWEFNMQQDQDAARVVFNSGVPLVHFPCWPAAAMLHTSVPELQRDLKGRSKVGDYLVDIVAGFASEDVGNASRTDFAWGKEIWDLAPCVWLVESAMCGSRIIDAPILGDDGMWHDEPGRHPIREALVFSKTASMTDVFKTIGSAP
ncbi:MAG: nucleoside hydrolase [Planctomycetota bacterium]